MGAGFLIVKRFETLYDDALAANRYSNNPKTKDQIYGIPHHNIPVALLKTPHYRGIDRQPLRGLTKEFADLSSKVGVAVGVSDATELMWQVQTATGREDGRMSNESDALAIFNKLGAQQQAYEIIFGKERGDPQPPPANVSFLGCDAAYFRSDHFSCICDALFFPRWHGTDPEGVLFKNHFAKLNASGLFDTHEQTLDYLQYYLSFDWTEHHGDFTSIEVYALKV